VRAPGIARAALAVLLLTAISIGLPASFAPQSFYDDYPFVANWVSLLPPYNRHLVTDVGGLYLGFAVVLGWAAWTLRRDLVRAVCAGWAVMALLHLVFHATHLDGFSTADAVAEVASLALVLAVPGVAFWGVGTRPAALAQPVHEDAREPL
jgi:hypothetical protein